MRAREEAAWPTWAVARTRDGAPVFAKPANKEARARAARWVPTAKAASALAIASTPQALFRAALKMPPLSFKLPCADVRRPRELDVDVERELSPLADRTLAYVVDPLMTGDLEQRRSAQSVLDEFGIQRLRGAVGGGGNGKARLALEPIADWCEMARALTVLCAIEASVSAEDASDREALFRRNGLLSRGLPLERGRVAIPFASAATTGVSELHRAICPIKPGGRRAFLGSEFLDVVVHGPADDRFAYVTAPAEAFRSEELLERVRADVRRTVDALASVDVAGAASRLLLWAVDCSRGRAAFCASCGRPFWREGGRSRLRCMSSCGAKLERRYPSTKASGQ